MKTLKNTQNIVLVILLTAMFSCKAQIATLASHEALIVGTWVAEGNSIIHYSVYESNGIVKRYVDNNLYKTYNWTIIERIAPSGLKSYYLTLVNSTDSNETYTHDIDTLNDVKLRLVYQRPGGGLGKPAVYLRQ